MFHHQRIGIKKERSADPMTRMAVVDVGPSVLLLQSKVFLPLQDKTKISLSYLFNNSLTVTPKTIMHAMVDGCMKVSSMLANMVFSRKMTTPATLTEV